MRKLQVALIAVFVLVSCMGMAQQPPKESPYQIRGSRVYYGSQSGHAYDGIYYIAPGVVAVRKGTKWGFADTTGRMLIGFKYTDVEPNDNAPVTVFNGKLRGFVGLNGKVIIDAVCTDMTMLEKGYIKISKEQKAGLISPDGRLILEPIYDGFDFIAGRRLIAVLTGANMGIRKGNAVQTGGKIGLVDTTGKVVVKPMYDDISDIDSKSGLMQVMIDGKSGLMNGEGKEVLAPKYDWINPMVTTYGYLQVKMGDNAGIIDTLGNEVIGTTYQAVFPLSATLFAAKQNEKWGIIDINGNQKIDFDFQTIATMYHDRILVRKDKKWGIIDTTGKFIVEPKYDKVDHTSFDKGALPVRGNKQVFLVDMDGRELLGNFQTLQSKLANGNVWERDGDGWKLSGSGTATYPRLRWYSPQMTIAYQGYKMALVDNNGKLLTGYDYDTIRYVNAGLACVVKGKKNGLVNNSGQIVLPVNYYLISNIGEGMCAVCEGNAEVFKRNGIPTRLIVCKWGFADSTGRMVIQPEFDNYEDFLNGYAPVTQGKKLGLIDSTGKVLVQPKYDKITPFQGKIAFVKLNGGWGVIDSRGNELIAPKFAEDYRLALPNTPPQLKAEYYPKLNHGYAVVFEGRKWGLVDSLGKIVVDGKYDKVYVNSDPKSNIIALVSYKKKWGAINAYGEEVIKPQYYSMLEFSEGLSRVATGIKYGYVDEKGVDVIEQTFQKAGVFKNGWAPVAVLTRRGHLKFFLIDSSGNPMPMR